MSMDDRPEITLLRGDLDVERGSDVPIPPDLLAARLPDRLWSAAARLPAPPVRELGAALRVNPNTIRAVYRRLSDAGYVSSRHGAGTHVADRPPQRRGAEALAGLVSEMLRRAAHAGFTADEVASATFAAATERKRPGPLVRVLFAECTNADAGYDAERLTDEFPGSSRSKAPCSTTCPTGSIAFTTTSWRRPRSTRTKPRPWLAVGFRSWRCSSARATWSSSTKSRGCRRAPRSACLRLERGAENIRETLALAGTTGIELVTGTTQGDEDDIDVVNKTADVILVSREAIRLGIDKRFDRPDRLRKWTYEFDPSGLELLRRAVEHAAASRPEPVPTA